MTPRELGFWLVMTLAAARLCYVLCQLAPLFDGSCG